jgi:hypothetical protein
MSDNHTWFDGSAVQCANQSLGFIAARLRVTNNTKVRCAVCVCVSLLVLAWLIRDGTVALPCQAVTGSGSDASNNNSHNTSSTTNEPSVLRSASILTPASVVTRKRKRDVFEAPEELYRVTEEQLQTLGTSRYQCYVALID